MIFFREKNMLIGMSTNVDIIYIMIIKTQIGIGIVVFFKLDFLKVDALAKILQRCNIFLQYYSNMQTKNRIITVTCKLKIRSLQ